MPKAKEKHMKIGKSLNELVTHYDQQFMKALPKLYEKKAEREVVEAIVIPHFRSELAKVLNKFQEQRKDAELPVLPDEVPALCEAVDAMIEANKVPLLVDEYFGKGLARINEMRKEAKAKLNEVFYAHCREYLMGKGVRDRRTLLQKGAVWFRKKTFPPFGSGKAFAGKILGRTIHRVKIVVLDEIAETLGLPEFDEAGQKKKICEQFNALQKKGLISRRLLLKSGPIWFGKEEFLPYGKGTAFASAVLGQTVVRVTIDVLNEIADRLDIPDVDEAEKEKELQRQRGVLTRSGIATRKELLQYGAMKFQKGEFPPYGKGGAFAGAILERKVGYLTINILNEIANRLELPDVDETKREKELQKYIKLLTKKGIKTRRDLIQKGARWFKLEMFDPYGKGIAFAKAILSHSGERMIITVERLNEIADVLGFARVDESEEPKKQREILIEKGIMDRRTLLKKGPTWFGKETFLPYGKGQAFAGSILGRPISLISREVLYEIAENLELPEVDEKVLEEEREKQRQALKRKKIISRKTLLKNGPVWFKKEEFTPYKKGISFARIILGRGIIGMIKLEDLEEIADILELPD